MTSPYDTKITKVKNALENVFLKKEEIIDELNSLLDTMIATETSENEDNRLLIIIINANLYGVDDVQLVDYINEVNYTEESLLEIKELKARYSYTNADNINYTVMFKLPSDLSLENACLKYISTNYTDNRYLYALSDENEDNRIIEDDGSLPYNPLA